MEPTVWVRVCTTWPSSHSTGALRLSLALLRLRSLHTAAADGQRDRGDEEHARESEQRHGVGSEQRQADGDLLGRRSQETDPVRIPYGSRSLQLPVRVGFRNPLLIRS